MMRKSKMNIWEFMGENPGLAFLLALVAAAVISDVLKTLAR